MRVIIIGGGEVRFHLSRILSREDQQVVPIDIDRIRNQGFSRENAFLTPEQLDIDQIINPELETAQEIVWLPRRAAATDVIEFAEDADIGAVTRNGKVFMPVGETLIQREDKVVIFTPPKAVADAEKMFE